MKKYKVYRSQRFDKELAKFDKPFQDRVDKIESHLSENPYFGSPLGVLWFREKRCGKYRVYYLIYDGLHAVFMAAISEKKDQQKVINTIRLLLGFFEEEIKQLVDKDVI